MTRKVLAAAFFSGLVFAIGLGVSGMTQPSKVIGFLDLFGGAWDPSLALVMAGAIAVHLPLYRLIRARPGSVPMVGSCGPIDDDELSETGVMGSVNAKVIAGAAIFGVGWGMGGYCPGPAVVSLASAAPGVLVFFGAMAAGMLMFHLMPRTVFAPSKVARASAPAATALADGPPEHV
jgi:uncharacterized membrane protein YedE/YeeE